MMDKRTLFLAAALAAAVAGAWAQDGSLAPAGETVADGRSWLAFKGPDGLRVLAASPMPEGAMARLERVAAAVAAWSSIRPTELRADFAGAEGDDYAVLVSSVPHKGKDYAANVPAGIRLRFAGALVYDFRVKAGEYFVRVKGVLMDDASLASEIAAAADDPAGYIAERDPSWATSRVYQLSGIIDSLETSMENSRLALAAQMNKGFFGGPRPLSADLVAFVKAAKKDDSALDRAAALAKAKEKGFKTSAKEMDVIFRVWFGE